MDRELTTTSTEIVSVVADDRDEAEEEEEEKTTEQPTSSAQCHVYLDKLESCLDRHYEEGKKTALKKKDMYSFLTDLSPVLRKTTLICSNK